MNGEFKINFNFNFNFNFKVKVKVKVKVKSLGCRPNRPQGGSIATPLENPGLFKTCAMHPGYVSETFAIAAKSRRYAVPFGRFTTRANTRAVFHLSLRRDF